MKQIGLREANQHFARMIRTVRRGEEVVLLDRGRPIATVTPVPEAQDAIAGLATRGLLTRGRQPGVLAPFRPVRVKGGLSRAVIDERNERG